MALYFLPSLAALLLLNLGAVSADITCTLESSITPGSVCDTFGVINDFGYYLEDLFDAQYLTSEGCAAACASHPNCLSFDLDVGSFCELQSGTQSQTGFVADSSSWYQGYDISCFNCVDSTTVASSSTSSEDPTSGTPTSSADPITSASPTTSNVPTSLPTQCSVNTQAPLNSVCGTASRAQIDSTFLTGVYTGEPVSSLEACALFCANESACGAFFYSVEDPTCQTISGTASETDWIDPTSPYYVYDMSCFDCTFSSTSSTSSIESSSTSSDISTATDSSSSSIQPTKTSSDLSVSTITSSASATTTGPLVCNQDNCLRAFLRFSSEASDFCASYTTSINAEPTDIPAYLENCDGDPVMVSSGCACVATSTISSSLASTTLPVTTSSSSIESSTASISTSVTSLPTQTSSVTPEISASASSLPISFTVSSTTSSPNSTYSISSSKSVVSFTLSAASSDSSTFNLTPSGFPPTSTFSVSTTSALYMNITTSRGQTVSGTSTRSLTSSQSSDYISSAAKIPESPSQTAPQYISQTTQQYTRSTVYATSVYTITSCAPTITNCPVGAVTTETIAILTTICPITQPHQTSSKKPLLVKPTSTPSQTGSIPAGYTVSTIYQTSVETITKCPAVLTACLPASVITKTIAISTTICAVTELVQPTSLRSALVTKSSTNPSHVPDGIPSTTVMPTPLSVGSYYSQALQSSSTITPISNVSIALTSRLTSLVSGLTPHSTLLPVLSNSETVKAQYSSSAGNANSLTMQLSVTGTSAGSATSAPVQVSHNAGGVVRITWIGYTLAVGIVAVGFVL